MASIRASTPEKRFSNALNRRSSAEKRASSVPERCCRSRTSAVNAINRAPNRSRVTPSSLIVSPDAAFEADGEELLRFDRELHRQFLQHVLAEAVDDQGQRVLVLDAALAAIKQLVVADLRGRRLMLDARRGVAHLDIG